MTENEKKPGSNFIRARIEDDVLLGKNDGQVITRFPPEPNGYLHIGHAKSICLNFGLARDFGGRCHLRFDDTNPTKEDVEYVEAIQDDIRWLGFDWGSHLYFASDYFSQLYEFAVQLIQQGDAYVCSLSAEQIRGYRGTLTEPGRNSPYRDRSVEENLDLFTRMKDGDFEEGQHVLRAKIDMASPNLNMRDPAMYRIRYASHHRTGEAWCIYPMYDFTHCISDSLEHITHSLCSLEFEDNRPLYDWFLDRLQVACHPQQIEFARLKLTYTLMSKRKLMHLVQQGIVDGWDDPRMPTLRGMRRRGYPAEAIRNFCERIGVAKADSTINIAQLEHAVREVLNRDVPRAMAVLNPIKVVLTNYPEGKTEELEAVNNPEDPSQGTRMVPFSRELYIERDDFREDPPRKYFRLAPGREVRLRYGYLVTCEEVVKDPDSGEITAIHCRYDPETRGGKAPDGRKVKGTIHWVSAAHAVRARVRVYDRLFMTENPYAVKEGGDFLDNINPASLEVLDTCFLEPSLADLTPEVSVQFERLGYFCSAERLPDGTPVFNRTVTLRDSWAKMETKGA